MRFFETIDSFITDLLTSVSQSMSSGFANSLYSIVGASLLLYYTLKGFAIFAGKIEAPAKELLYDFASNDHHFYNDELWWLFRWRISNN